MNFKDEYKKSVDNASPDKEAIGRMKAAVLAKIADEQGQFPQLAENLTQSAETSPLKKPLPFKRIAFIGGAVAACAVVTVSAVTLLPDIKSTNAMLSSETLSSVAEDFPAAAADADNGGSLGNEEIVDNSESNKGFSNPSNDNTINIDIVSDAADSTSSSTVPTTTTAPIENSTQPEDVIAETTVSTDDSAALTQETDRGHEPSEPNIEPNKPAPDVGFKQTDEAENDDVDSADENEIAKAETVEANDSAIDTPTNPATGTPDGNISEYLTGEAGYTDDAVVVETNEVLLATEESGFMETEEFTCDAISAEASEEEIVEEEPKLVLTDKGWLTYGGKRYDLDSGVKSALFPVSPIEVANVLDGKDYFLYVDGYVLKVFDEKKLFLGLYRLRV